MLLARAEAWTVVWTQALGAWHELDSELVLAGGIPTWLWTRLDLMIVSFIVAGYL
jgi:hypothetical protein